MCAGSLALREFLVRGERAVAHRKKSMGIQLRRQNIARLDSAEPAHENALAGKEELGRK